LILPSFYFHPQKRGYPIKFINDLIPLSGMEGGDVHKKDKGFFFFGKVSFG
jgi:hypothetical protein